MYYYIFYKYIYIYIFSTYVLSVLMTSVCVRVPEDGRDADDTGRKKQQHKYYIREQTRSGHTDTHLFAC
jgi:hypothetical protein